MRPYGYEPDRYTIRQDEAEVIRLAAAKVLDGESLRSVAESLNTQGILTPPGNPWKPNVLRRILTSPRVAGKVLGRDGKTKKADWPAILDDKTHKKLVALSSKQPQRGNTPKLAYLLTGGIARCGLCGHELYARPEQPGKRSYVCATGTSFGGCGKIRINAVHFENDVAERVLARLIRPDSQRKMNAAVNSAVKTAEEADQTLVDVDRRLKEVAVEYADGKITVEQMNAATARLRKRARDARAAKQLASVAEEYRPVDTVEIVEWWESASLEQQRALLELLVSKVEVFPAPVRGSKVFDPSRVKVTWRR